MSSRLFFRLGVQLVDLFARMFFLDSVRDIPRRLAGLYALPAKDEDDLFFLEERKHSGTNWKLFVDGLRAYELPRGVCRDTLPPPPISCRDVIGFHSDVLVLGIHPTAFGRSGKACRLMQYGVLKPFVKGHLRTSDLVVVEKWLAGKDVRAVQVEKAAILDERMGHFGHWVFEQLPQLRLLQDRKDVHLIFNANDAWKRKLLVDFGWPEDKLLTYSGSEVFEVQELWTTNGGNLNLKDLGWLRDKGKECYGEDANAPKRIYVSRQGVGSRMVQNFAEVKPVLDEFDIALVRPEELGIEGSVRMFGNAEFIIGPEGSGTRNMVWSKQAKVVEIFGHEVNFGQWAMAHALGFEFAPYIEEREVPDSELRWRDIDARGIPVDPIQLRQFLLRHLGE